MPPPLYGHMLSCGAQQFSWTPLLPCWWQTASTWRGSQNALQATCAVLLKTIEIIISLCPARIQSWLSQQGGWKCSWLTCLLIALLCSTRAHQHGLLNFPWPQCILAIAHYHNFVFPRNLGDPILPPDFKLDCDGQKLYASSNIVADSKKKNLWLWLMKLMKLGFPIRCQTLQQNQNLQVWHGAYLRWMFQF